MPNKNITLDNPIQGSNQNTLQSPVLNALPQPRPIDVAQAMSTTVPVNQAIPQSTGGMFGSIGQGLKNIMSDPNTLAYFLGSLAAATSPQGAWSQAVGQAVMDMAKNEQYNNYLRQLLSALGGNQNPFQSSPIQLPATSASVIGLSPQEQMAGVNAALAQKAQQLEEKKAPYSSFYQASMGQAALENAAINRLRLLAEFAKGNGIALEPIHIDLGDRVVAMAYNDQTGDYDIKLVLKKGKEPGSTSSGTITPSLKLAKTELVNSLFPVLERTMKELFPNEAEYSDRLKRLKDEYGNYDQNAIISTLGTLSPEFARIWQSYFAQAENILASGGKISDLKFPAIRTDVITLDKDRNNIVFKDINENEAEFYSGVIDMGDGNRKYVVFFKPAGETIPKRVYIHDLKNRK